MIGPVLKMILAPVQAAEAVDRNSAPRWNSGDSEPRRNGIPATRRRSVIARTSRC